jgi:hypothetical protein
MDGIRQLEGGIGSKPGCRDQHLTVHGTTCNKAVGSSSCRLGDLSFGVSV